MTIDEPRAQAAANTTAGKVQDALGALKGDLKMQAEGKLRQAKGKAQEVYGQLTERTGLTASDVDRFVRSRPWEAVGIAAGLGLLVGLMARR